MEVGPRFLDELGRVVVPAEVRSALGVGDGDAVAFEIAGSRVLLKKAGGNRRRNPCATCRGRELCWLLDKADKMDKPPDRVMELVRAWFGEHDVCNPFAKRRPARLGGSFAFRIIPAKPGAGGGSRTRTGGHPTRF